MIHRHRPGPKLYAEINNKPRIVVLQPREWRQLLLRKHLAGRAKTQQPRDECDPPIRSGREWTPSDP